MKKKVFLGNKMVEVRDVRINIFIINFKKRIIADSSYCLSRRIVEKALSAKQIDNMNVT